MKKCEIGSQNTQVAVFGIQNFNFSLYSPGPSGPIFISRPRISNDCFSEVHVRQKEWEKRGRIEKNGHCSENKFLITLIMGIKQSKIPLQSKVLVLLSMSYVIWASNIHKQGIWGHLNSQICTPCQFSFRHLVQGVKKFSSEFFFYRILRRINFFHPSNLSIWTIEKDFEGIFLVPFFYS